MTCLLKVSVAGSTGQHNAQKTDWHSALQTSQKKGEFSLGSQGSRHLWSTVNLLLSCTVASFNLSYLPLLTFAIIWCANSKFGHTFLKNYISIVIYPSFKSYASFKRAYKYKLSKKNCFTPWKPIILHWKKLQDTFSHNLYKNPNIKCDFAIIIIGLSLKFKKNFFL